MDIKNIIKEKRLELGLTQKELSLRTGVSEGTISRWESGDIKNMRRDKIYALAKTLGISPAEIMGFTEAELRAFEKGDLIAYASNDPEAINLLIEYQELKPTDKARVIQFCKALKMLY